MGTLTFAGDTSKAMANTNISANDRIFLTRDETGTATRTFLSYSISAGVSFTVFSRDAAGTLTAITGPVYYVIVRQL